LGYCVFQLVFNDFFLFEQVNETWQDASKCINYTCVEVANPCYPSNTSAQIEVTTPVCAKCPEVCLLHINTPSG